LLGQKFEIWKPPFLIDLKFVMLHLHPPPPVYQLPWRMAEIIHLVSDEEQ
jgi:hypothetical protein